MPHLGVGDRVKETTTTTGTGTIDLGGAESGFQTFVDGVGNGHETYYVIVDSGTGDYEVGVGTITDAATDTLSRDTVISSSNAGALVNFGAGSKDVFCSLPSERAVIIDDASNVEVTANITATSFDGSGAALTALNASNVSSGTLPNARLDAQLQDIAGLATTSGKIIQGDGANFVLSAYTIPTSDGTTGQVLTTNGSGAVTFQSPTVGDITAVTAGSGLTGGGTSGDVTLNVGAGTGVTVNADDIAIGQDVATSASPTFAGGTFTANVAFGDLDFINMGPTGEYQIYHDHANGVSVIKDVDAGGKINIEADTVQLTGTANINSAYTLPTSDGTSGQVLTTNGSGALAFQTPTVGDITGVTAGSGLTGGGTSGDVTLNVGAGTGVTVAADTVSIGQDVATSASPTFAGLTTTGNINLGDNDFLRFGAAGDLQIYHDGSDSYISDNGGTGNLYIIGGSLLRLGVPGGGSFIDCNQGGNVSLQFNNSTKLETTSTGIDVTGGATFTANVSLGDNDYINLGASNDLQIYHNGSNSIIKDAGTGDLRISATNMYITNGADNEAKAYFGDNGPVELYYDNSKKFETTSGGIDVTGTITFDGGTTSADLNFGDNDKAVFGAGSDLEIFHNGSNSYISDNGTGDLYIRGSSQIRLTNPSATENYAVFNDNGAVSLYYDNSLKLATTSSGVDVTGTVTADGVSLGDNENINLGASNDLQMYHDGSNSYIRDNGTGDLVIQFSDDFLVRTTANENCIRANENSSVDLYFDNSIKLQTTSAGVTVTGTLTETSSIEYKENVKPLEFNEAIYNVNAVKYDRKDGSQKDEVGVIAEDLYEILPDLVQTKDGKPESVKYTKLTMYLLEALKKQNQEIQLLKEKIN